MPRLTETALFLAPFALLVAWWLLGGLSRRTLWVFVGSLVGLVGMTLWVGLASAPPRGRTYVPAHVEQGRVVPGHGV